MTTTAMPNKNVHEGRNVKRFREMMGLKQEALAEKLGEDWTQKKISQLESKETIEPEILEQVASALNVSAKAIQSFDEEKAMTIIQNNYEGSNPGAAYVGPANYMNQCTFNALEKWVEAIEENRKLYNELLKSERDKIALLEKLLAEKEK
jgi:transcriptional regulator with XRE-family HTH domain